MTAATETVYPDLLRTGLSKLATTEARRDLLSLFAALDYFRQDLHAQESAEGILDTTHQYVDGLGLFRHSGFYLVNSKDHGFDLAVCGDPANRAPLDAVVRGQIRSGRFAAGLRESSLVFFDGDTGPDPVRGVLRKLAVPQEVFGMFCGVLERELPPTNEIAFSLLSMLLGSCADALATTRRTARLRLEIKTLSDLVPICAWCRKIRDDRGYWEQIEDFIRSHSDASFSHGICPDCQKQFLEELPEASAPTPSPTA